MREIARAVDASPMGLYRYFEDRDAIIAYLRTRAFTRFAERLETAFAKGADPFARARAVGRAYLDFALETPATIASCSISASRTKKKTPRSPKPAHAPRSPLRAMSTT